ncbi:hypothetical protein HYH02_010139 [Chlamydomonas schloesseri]|uniref:Fe2OG dioxygenase domain-containing protein n=1 Tax=Chlamydomonas schloesseri TaxID=2026947 RepID=A0A835TMR2_9CHLO|nr:hypothetical protein HYH02_010139 [Chlamydomonas schloesseri]|eukprot:KAG2440555.1 hypothetical protein HYH02_010139 [Chlamydomonas schloesseri]
MLRFLGLALLALAPLATFGTAAEYPSLALPAFSLAELKAPDDAALRAITNAIADLGMFAVTGVSGGPAAHDALSSLVACAARGEVPLRKVEMEDGAIRHTLATATTAGVPQPLPADAVRACPDFAVAANRLRAAVAATGGAYAAVLDRLLYGAGACTPQQLLASGKAGTAKATAAIKAAAGADDADAAQQVRCYGAAVRAAESLEHFHVFRPAPAAAAATGAAERTVLGLHSDIGMFLVMTPAELFASTPQTTASSAAAATTTSSIPCTDDRQQQARRAARDLVVQLRDGRLVAPALPGGGDVLLVMNGEGLTRWMRPASTGLQPYSPLHEVLSTDMGGGVRAWFGRMFMPPPSARLQALPATDSGSDVALFPEASANKEPAFTAAAGHGAKMMMTFAEYRAQTYALFRAGRGAEAPSMGCSPSRRRLVDEGSCGADQAGAGP